MESGKAPAAGGSVEGFTCILQTGSALLPLRLQGVFALLLCLLQLHSHIFGQLGCPLVAVRDTFHIIFILICLSFYLFLKKSSCWTHIFLVTAVMEGLHEVFMLLLISPHHLLHLFHPVQSSPHLLVHQFLPIQRQLWERERERLKNIYHTFNKNSWITKINTTNICVNWAIVFWWNRFMREELSQILPEHWYRLFWKKFSSANSRFKVSSEMGWSSGAELRTPKVTTRTARLSRNFILELSKRLWWQNSAWNDMTGVIVSGAEFHFLTVRWTHLPLVCTETPIQYDCIRMYIYTNNDTKTTGAI